MGLPKLASTQDFGYYQVFNGSPDRPNEYNGAVMVFNQSTAPTGWTKLTSTDDATLRVVSGPVTSGGSVNFSTAFVNQPTSGSITGGTFNTGNTTLSTPQLPSHTHSGSGWTFSTGPITIGSGFSARFPVPTNPTANSGSGGNHLHTTPISSVADTFTGSPINMAVRYVDNILASYP